MTDGKTDPVLCTRGCGFYGRPETNGLCSRCASSPQPAATGGDLAKLSERELRAIIATGGLQSDDCFTIAELRARAKLAAPVELETTQLVMGGLTCFIKGPLGEKLDLVVVMFHGWNARAAELFPVADSMANNPQIKGLKVLYVIPQAPGSPSAWWDIDIGMWMHAAITGNIEQLLRTVPRGLLEARVRGLQLLREIQGLGLGDTIPMSRIIIGGFSQGAMTAVDLALQLPPEEICGGVMALSGSPIVVEEWEERLLALPRPPPVLITHGVADPVLPVLAADIMHKILERGKCDVTIRKHSGGHELGPSDIVTSIAQFWLKIAGSEAKSDKGAADNAAKVLPKEQQEISASPGDSSFVLHMSNKPPPASSSSSSSSSSSAAASGGSVSFCSSSSSPSFHETKEKEGEEEEKKTKTRRDPIDDVINGFVAAASVMGPNGLIVTPLMPLEDYEEEDDEEEEEEAAEAAAELLTRLRQEEEEDDEEMLAKALALSLQGKQS